MHAKDAISHTLDMSDMILKKYVEDLDDKDLLVEPESGMNPIALQIGHLITVEHNLVDEIKPGASPALPDGFAAAHDLKNKAANAKFLSKAEYLRLWDAQRAATKSLVASLDDAGFDKPAPDHWQRMVPTVGLALNLAGAHTLMHVGQFVPVRRKLNKGVVI